MPSFWNRVGLAAALAAQITASANLSFAQDSPHSGIHGTTQPCATQPCATQPWPGRSHVGPPGSMIPEPPPWVEQAPTTDTPPMPPMTDTPPTPPMTDVPPLPETPFTPDSNLAFSTAQTGIGSADQPFAPNMIGDLLKGYRSVSFPYNGGGDFSAVLSAGATNLRNSKVSENNSAVPRTRFSFRYNYFHNANDVQGFKLSPETINVQNFDFNSTGNPPNLDIPKTFPASRSFDAHFYTLGWEQAFWDNLASVEVRIPFAHTLDSRQTFIGSREVPGTGAQAPASTFELPDTFPANDPFFVGPQSFPANVPVGAAPLVTPGNDVLGTTDTELQDISFILKRVLWQSRDRRYLVSGGLGTTVPTGQDVDIRVVDSYDDFQGFEPNTFDGGGSVSDPNIDFGFSPFNAAVIGSATNIRTRDIHIENEIWELAPFLAMVALPTDRTFVNGFLQVNVPLNSADVTYRERRADIVARDIFPNVTGVNAFGETFGPNGLEGDFRQQASIQDQMLLQIDLGGGYWLLRNPQARYVTGVASLLELHYTTSLENADIATFQPQPVLFGSGTAFSEPPTRIGNLANRIDFLNLTIGGAVQLANSATVAVGYVTPLRDDFDRTFDGELNVQFNLYR